MLLTFCPWSLTGTPLTIESTCMDQLEDAIAGLDDGGRGDEVRAA